MTLEIFFVVAITSVIQSIFGVGVLLFGTPILLVLGYRFNDSIIILLPISLVINSFQIKKNYKEIDCVFYKKVLFYSIPPITFFLFVITKLELKIEVFIAAFLFFIALKEYFPKLNNYVQLFMKYEKMYLIVTGAIHGATNLGGSLLTVMIHNKGYNKNVSRATIAVSYASFAFFQLVTLVFLLNNSDVNFLAVVFYLFVGIVVFFITEKILYVEISDEKYNKLFSVFLFGSGLLLCLKSI